MNQEQLLKHFDRIAEAPDAVPRLRRFILDLAVRGKLVGQDPHDEPGTELLKRIQTEKARRNLKERAKPGKGRKLAPNEQTPYHLPSGWVWVSLADLTAVLNGRAYSKNELLDQGTPVLRVGNLFTSDHWYYSNLTLDDDKYCDAGDLLFSWSASFGPFIWPGPRVIYHYHIWKLSLHDELSLDKNYLYRFLLHKTQEIKDSGHGVSMLHMTKEKMELVQVPLPPLAEQRRIVAKVDELMALCDRLEAAQNKREQRRERLVTASLHQLQDEEGLTPRRQARQGRQDNSFSSLANLASLAPWRESVFLQNLPRLTARPEHIKALRQTILCLAVRGRLVPQDPKDEPAFSLIDEIARQQGNATGPQRKNKVTSASSQPSSEGLETLPASWELATVGKLMTFGPQNGVSPKATKDRDAPRALTLTATTSGILNVAYYKHIEIAENECENYWLAPGDFLFQRGNTREYVGMAVIYDGPSRSFVFPDLMIRVRFSELLNLRFIHLAMISAPLRAYFSRNASGASTTMPKINQGVLLGAPVPVPPKAEQHRIVAKVDELMAICDQLEANLTSTQADSRRLLEAVLRDALA